MDYNLSRYLKRVKMTGEMFRVEMRIDTCGSKCDKISFINEPNFEELYKNAFESLYEDDIKYKDLFLESDKH